MGLIHNVLYRIVNFVNRARTKTNCCCAMVVIVVITHIALNRAWKRFLKVIGECLSENKPNGSVWLCVCVNFNGGFFFFCRNRYCYECVNKATSERKCIVCGGHRTAPVGKMIYCELCPRAYHHDCYIPPMIKVNTHPDKNG
jgi:hypothetical protein